MLMSMLMLITKKTKNTDDGPVVEGVAELPVLVADIWLLALPVLDDPTVNPELLALVLFEKPEADDVPVGNDMVVPLPVGKGGTV